MPQFPHVSQRKSRSSVGATTPPSVPEPGLPRVGAAARTAPGPGAVGNGKACLCGQVQDILPDTELALRQRQETREQRVNGSSTLTSQSLDSLLLPCAPPSHSPRNRHATWGQSQSQERARFLEPLTWAGRASGLSPEHATFGWGSAKGALDVGLAPKPKSLQRVRRRGRNGPFWARLSSG